LVRHYVDDIILVSESETIQALAYIWHQYSQMVEGSAAVVMAAILNHEIDGHPRIAVISGGNIQPSLFYKITSSEQ
jgi:threonine dehydratase